MMRPTHRSIVTVTIVLSVLLWGVAAVTPAYFSQGRAPDIYGLMCFMYGPLALMFMTVSGVGWLANIFAVVAAWLLGRRRYKKAFIYAVIGVIIGCSALFVTEVPANESGDVSRVTLGPGVFLWLGSLAVILLGSLIAMLNKNTRESKFRLKDEKDQDLERE